MANFVNPYTFIPLQKGKPSYLPQNDEQPQAEGCPVAEAECGSEAYTGVLRCSLTTRTPLCIPASTPKDGETSGGLDLPFFRIDNRLAIPGSSLRGCIRSVYEVLTDSCLRTNDIHLRSASGKKAPGLLMWGRQLEGAKVVQVLKIVEAKRLRVVDESLVVDAGSFKFQDGDRVNFTAESEPNRPYVSDYVTSINEVGDRATGYFLHVHTLYSKGRNGRETHNHPSVFTQTENRHADVVDAAAKTCLEENADLFVANSLDQLERAEDQEAYALALANLAAAREYRQRLAAFLKEKDGNARFPVWYSREELGGGKYAYQLAWSQFSRSVYPQTPKLMAGKRAQCTSAASLCPACTPFGFAAPKGREALAGRVRFSDAVVADDKQAHTSVTVLATLLEPRQSALEFYLRNKSEGYETSFTPLTPGTELVGRKAYWHHQDGRRWENAGKATKFNLRAEIVPTNVTFGFDVYVDGVSERELNQLLYALTYGQWWGVSL